MLLTFVYQTSRWGYLVRFEEHRDTVVNLAIPLHLNDRVGRHAVMKSSDQMTRPSIRKVEVLLVKSEFGVRGRLVVLPAAHAERRVRRSAPREAESWVDAHRIRKRGALRADAEAERHGVRERHVAMEEALEAERLTAFVDLLFVQPDGASLVLAESSPGF